jgi:hypothetical protein
MNSASSIFPNAIVAMPATSRIRLKTVKTLARTMLAYDRLDAGGSTGPRAASRRCASASLRPSGEGVTWVVAVSMTRP